MKTMTCTQLGGPCNLQLNGNTGDEVIKATRTGISVLLSPPATSSTRKLCRT